MARKQSNKKQQTRRIVDKNNDVENDPLLHIGNDVRLFHALVNAIFCHFALLVIQFE